MPPASAARFLRRESRALTSQPAAMRRRVRSDVRRLLVALVALIAVVAALGCGASMADRPAARDTTRVTGTASDAATTRAAAGSHTDTLWLLAAVAAGDAVHAV